MPNKQSQADQWPQRDGMTDEDGPHSSRDIPRDRAQDAGRPTPKPGSKDIDPDSAESEVDRDDTNGEP